MNSGRAAFGVVIALIALTTHAANPPLRIGLLLPPEEAFRESLRHGAESAVTQFNATSQVPLELVVRGRAGQWGDDADEAGRLVLDDEVRLVIAPPGAVPSHLMLQVAGRTRTPVISLAPDDSITGAGIPWAIRWVPTLQEEWKALLTPGHWRWVVEAGRPAREGGRELAKARRSDWWRERQLDLEVVPWEPAAVSDATLGRQVESVMAGQPTGVLLGLNPLSAARWVRALRREGFRGRLAGAAWLRSDRFTTAAGDPAKDFRVAALAVEKTNAAQPISTAGERDAAGTAAFDSVQWATALMRQAGDRPLYTMFPLDKSGVSTRTGAMFDRTGNRLGRMESLRWDGQAWVPTE